MKLARERVLIGAGGFARDVQAHMNISKIKCFVDARFVDQNDDSIFPLEDFDPFSMEALIAIADPRVRKQIHGRLPLETQFFSFIHPSAQILSTNNQIGKGVFISANCIITTNVILGDHALLNWSSTIGHDCRIGDYLTMAPGSRISGNCVIGECFYIGTNASIKQKVEICNNVTVGLQAGVVKNINDPGIYVGCPARKQVL